MSKLSKREVLLINLLLLIGVIGAGYFMWLAPLMVDIDSLKNQHETLKTEEMRVSYLIENGDVINQKYEEAKTNYELQSELFSDELTNLDVLNMVKSSGLTLDSINRGPITISKIPVISAQIMNYEYDLNTMINVIEGNVAEVPVVKESSNDFAYQDITVNVIGTLAQGESLVKKVEDTIKTGYVTLFSREDSEQRMNFVIRVYSLKPLESNY